jgi:hypothetical protein
VILEPELTIEPETRTDFTPVIAPSAALMIAAVVLEATPLPDGELLPQAETAPATPSAQTSQVVSRRRTLAA